MTYEQPQCRMCFNYGRVMLSLTPTPIANNFADHPDHDAPTYPLELQECFECGHVQLRHQVPIEWNNYKYSTPSANREHLANAAQETRSRYPKAKTVLEIGSNNGLYLEELRKVGFQATGIDPCAMDGVSLPFSDELARTLEPVDVIVANNVLAHVDDLWDVFRGIDRLMKEDSALVLEVQDFDEMWLSGAFDMIYHEHRDYHTYKTWPKFLKRFGLVVAENVGLSTHGGSMRLYCERPGLTHPLLMSGEIDWRYFKRQIADAKHSILDQVSEVNGPLVALGAPAKATTLIHHFGLDDLIDICLDSTPAKQGKYIPGTGIRIEHPETLNRNTTQPLLVLAWNFEHIFRQQYPNAHFIVPFKEVLCPTR